MQVKYNVEVAGLSGRPREPEAHGTRRPFRKGEDSNPAVMTAVSVASSSAGVPTHTNYVSKEEFEAVRAAAQREILALMQKLSEREVIATCAGPVLLSGNRPGLSGANRRNVADDGHAKEGRFGEGQGAQDCERGA